VSAESANMSRWVSSMIKVERVSRMGRALAMVRAERSSAGHHDLGEGDGRMKARYILINMTKFIRVRARAIPSSARTRPQGLANIADERETQGASRKTSPKDRLRVGCRLARHRLLDPRAPRAHAHVHEPSGDPFH
jgi:hypothetical protein